MKCPKCAFENPEAMKFCGECGSKLQNICPECNSINPAQFKFCGECGHNLSRAQEAAVPVHYQPRSYTPKFLADKILTTRSSIEGERKRVTVMFADVAGFTPMCEKLDPEEVHDIMDRCFRILMNEIHRYEGTVNEFRGDGVMALFGAPIAHEDHAQRACLGALGVQEALVPYSEELEREYGIDFKMRIGLNSGDVIVGAIGDDLRMDYTAQGDTANLAARMESNALPGTILVSQNTYRLAKEFFLFDSLGAIPVKGKDEPVETYQLAGRSDVETRIAASVAKGLSRFVGRSTELDILVESFEKARAGSGQVVAISGEAGVGKSRLLLEFRHRLPHGDYSYLEGRCIHYGEHIPYLPVIDMLKSYFGIREDNQESVIKNKIVEKLQGVDGDLKGLLASLHEVLSLKVENEAYLRLESRQKRERTFEALRKVLIQESESRPLILAFEDLHWIDNTTEQFVDFLIDSLAGSRILMLLLYRPEYRHRWGGKSYYTKLGMTQLSAASSTELVKAVLEESEIVPELRELILAKTAGNPLFIEELTHTLVENGSIQRKGDKFVLARSLSEEDVPDSIQGIIAGRIDRLEDNLKRLLQVASVIGREFFFRILQSITGMQEDLKTHLLNLQGLEFIYEKKLFPELEYIFKHALTQEVAYNSLLHKRRKDIHERIGAAIEDAFGERLEEFYEILAYHYSRSDNASIAVKYLALSNEKAAKANAMEEAKAHFQQAVRILENLSESEASPEYRISLVVKQVIVYEMLFKMPEYYELLTRYEPMLARIDNPGLAGAFYARMGHCEWWFGDLDQAVENLNRAVTLCEDAGNAEEAAYAYMMLEWTYLWKADYERVLGIKEDALRNVEQRFHLRWYVWALSPVSWAYTLLGRWDEAFAVAQKALEVSEEYSDNSIISFALFVKSWAHLHKGDLNGTIKCAQESLQKAPTLADKTWASAPLSIALNRVGETDKGIELVAPTIPALHAVRWMPGVVNYTAYLGEGYYLAGQFDKARQLLEETLLVARKCGMRWYIAFIHRLLGEIALRTDHPQATQHFEECIAILEEIKAQNDLALAYAGYGRLYKQQGNVGMAREYLTKALEIFERLGTLLEPEKVKRELADLAAE